MGRRPIAVFGSSEAIEGEPLYEEARRVGRCLAAAGFGVITGGYGGVMEAASRGAVEIGGETLGVTSSAFRGRRPNPYLSEIVETPTLYDRTRTLIERAHGYVVLWGKSGTLAEAALVWALGRAGSFETRPMIMLGAAWARLVGQLTAEGMLEESELRATRIVKSPDEAVEALSAMLAEGT